MTRGPKVLITGSGAICAAGKTADAILETVSAGKSTIAPIRQWDATQWPTSMAAEVADYNATALVPDRKLHKLIRRSDVFGLYAAGQALEAAGFPDYRRTLDEEANTLFADRTGIYVGSGGGAYESQYEFFPLMSAADGDLRVFGEELAASVNPMWLLRTLPNNVLCHIGIRHVLKGANACITNHSVGGALAIIEAAEALRAGEADRAVAVGHDTPIEPQLVLYYARAGLLGAGELRPFDARRNGSVFGEGAGALVLETEAAANARQAKVIGEFLGSGQASEAQGLLAIRPDGDGLARAIALALEDAQLTAADVGMIVAHGNGTRQSDGTEAAAIQRVFGAATPPITALKWSFGHLIAASGIVETAVALAALGQRAVPGIAPLEHIDPAFADLSVAAAARAPRSDVALVISRGFGGTNAALLVRAPSTR